MMLERDAPLYVDDLCTGGEGRDGVDGGGSRVGAKYAMSGLPDVNTQPLDHALVEALSEVAQANILDELVLDDELMYELRGLP